MRVTVRLHLERDGKQLMWWAESPDVEGFSATAESAHDLHELVQEALRDTVEDPASLEVRYQFAREEEPARGPVDRARPAPEAVGSPRLELVVA